MDGRYGEFLLMHQCGQYSIAIVQDEIADRSQLSYRQRLGRRSREHLHRMGDQPSARLCGRPAHADSLGGGYAPRPKSSRLEEDLKQTQLFAVRLDAHLLRLVETRSSRRNNFTWVRRRGIPELVKPRFYVDLSLFSQGIQ